jgi:hypothetical protein
MCTTLLGVRTRWRVICRAPAPPHVCPPSVFEAQPRREHSRKPDERLRDPLSVIYPDHRAICDSIPVANGTAGKIRAGSRFFEEPLSFNVG